MVEYCVNSSTSDGLVGSPCDECGGKIVESDRGFVCDCCGLTLDSKVLQYHAPYDFERVQYAPLGSTQVGTKREAARTGGRFRHLSKLHSIKDGETAALGRGRREISRIFSCLDLPVSLKKAVYAKFCKIRSALPAHTKFRGIDKLVPLTIFVIMKMEGISIDATELLEISSISKKDFNSFMLVARNFVPEFTTRDRQVFISNRVLKVVENFGLDFSVYLKAKEILFSQWRIIGDTTDDVIAGLCLSLSILCLCKGEVSINSVCKELNIRMSTIQSQVKRKLIDQYNVEGFATLIRSADLIKDTLRKIGLYDECSVDISVEISACNDVSELDEIPIDINLEEMAQKADVVLEDLEGSTSNTEDNNLSVLIEPPAIDASELDEIPIYNRGFSFPPSRDGVKGFFKVASSIGGLVITFKVTFYLKDQVNIGNIIKMKEVVLSGGSKDPPRLIV